MKLTILTTTYNRKEYLLRLLKSLQEQTDKNFEWLVIDDGSTDETDKYMAGLPQMDFVIKFYKKMNGGKHTALNYAHKYINGDFVLILDSDDYLLPNAVETILKDWGEYYSQSNIGVISYEKGYENGRNVSKRINVPDYYINDHIHFRINLNVKGDQCEVIRTEILKKYPFPVYENEKYMSEAWLWNNVAKEYLTVYRRKVIYICEYLENGLTDSGRKIRMQSPLGMMDDCKMYFNDKVSILIQLKEMILFCVYGFCSNVSLGKWVNDSGRSIKIYCILPLGCLLFLYWKIKYCQHESRV